MMIKSPSSKPGMGDYNEEYTVGIYSRNERYSVKEREGQLVLLFDATRPFSYGALESTDTTGTKIV